MEKNLFWSVMAWAVFASVNTTTSNKGVFLDLQNLLPDYDFERSIGDEIEFRVLVTSNPPPNIVWVDNHGFRSKEIPFSKNDGRNSGNQLTTLKINNITSNDIGEYVLRADNGHFKKEITFRLLVLGKPKIDIWMSSIKVVFEITSYPASVTKCYYSDCNETLCSNENEFESYSMDLKLRSSKIKEYLEAYDYNFVDNKTVRCVAENAAGFGKTQLIAKYDLANSPGGHYISHSESISPESHLISLECCAYDESYSDDVTWLDKDGKIIETSNDIRVERKRDVYNYRSLLHWDAQIYHPSGEFKCQARLLKNGSIVERVWSPMGNESVRKLVVIIDGDSNGQRNNQTFNTLTEVKQAANRLETIACHPHLFRCKTASGCEFNKWVCNERTDCSNNFNMNNCPLDEDQEAPLITPNQRDVTVKPGDNYDFTCESTEPVTWIYDDYIKRAYEEDRERAHRKWEPRHFNPQITHTSDLDGVFKSTIMLRNIHYTFVGYYYCIKNSSKNYEMSHLLKSKVASRIYLFVEDPDHQIVFADKNVISDNPNFVIPCKPTSKNVSLSIQLKIYDSILDNSETYAYSEYDGFKPTTKKIRSEYYYNCVLRKGIEGYSVKRDYTVASAVTTFFPPTIITPTEAYSGMTGHDLELECVVQSYWDAIPANLTWITPNSNRAQEENRTATELFSTNKEKLPKITSKLALKHFDKLKDVGQYECVLGVGSNQIISTYFHIKSPNDGKQFIKLWENSDDSWGDFKGRSREFGVHFKGNPIPKIGWLGVDGKQIPWMDQDSYEKKVVATKGSDWSKLRFNNLTFDDTGYYKFFVENEQQRKEKIFQLKVKGDPEIKMKESVYVKPGQNVTIDVEIVSYPRAYWTRCVFTPCTDNGLCDDQFYTHNQILLTSDWVHQSVIKQSTKILLSPARNGTVRCVANNGNSRDQTEVTTKVIVSNHGPNDPTLEEKPSLLTSVRHIFDYLF